MFRHFSRLCRPGNAAHRHQTRRCPDLHQRPAQGQLTFRRGQNFAIKLKSGEYSVEAIKPGDGPTEHYGQKSIFVSDDTLQTITLELKERSSASFRNQLKQKFGGRVPQIATVSIPAGSIDMGDTWDSDTQPIHKINIAAFDMGKTEVTFDQWDACAANGGCDHYPNDKGWGRGNRPVINVSWDDVQQYIKWLNKTTGQTWRLPSEAEWEYAARAGTTTPFSTGECLSTAQANYDGNRPRNGCQTGEYRKQTMPVGSFAANQFGLHDVHGNVQEWTQDCWNNSFSNAPRDGSAWVSADCRQRVVRGGSWYSDAVRARSAYRNKDTPDYRRDIGGFRLARSR